MELLSEPTDSTVEKNLLSKTHKNALFSVSGRKAMVEMVLIEKKTKFAVAEKFNVTPATVRKWVKRYASEGESGLDDRSSRPNNSPRATPIEKVEEIIAMRKEGKLTGDHIARKLNMHRRTVSRHLNRAKLSRENDIEDRAEEPPRRYEHEALGDLIHLDIKKLRNFNEEGVRNCNTGNRYISANKVAGSQRMHVAIDDHSCYASVSKIEDETAGSVTKH